MEPSIVPVSQDDPFPLNNLPYGSFTHPSLPSDTPHLGVAIGSYALSLPNLYSKYPNSLPKEIPPETYSSSTLNKLMSHGPDSWKSLRQSLKDVLKQGGDYNLDDLTSKKILVERSGCRMYMPIQVGDYTDFYSSREHAEHIGEMFRGKDKALMPNWLWMAATSLRNRSTSISSSRRCRRRCCFCSDRCSVSA